MSNGAKWNPFGGGAGQRPMRGDFISGPTRAHYSSRQLAPGRTQTPGPRHDPTDPYNVDMGYIPYNPGGFFNEQGFLDATAHYERMEALREKRQEAMQNLMAYGQEDLGPSAPSMQQFGPVSKSQFNLIDMVPEESIYDRQEKRKRKFFTEGLV